MFCLLEWLIFSGMKRLWRVLSRGLVSSIRVMSRFALVYCSRDVPERAEIMLSGFRAASVNPAFWGIVEALLSY
ncbi:MAG: hypothetical protein HQM09_03565 [Candidatus Riflebacteria bacterium]|nr:hypothetical protein [Candidatus Riflebacteria bacterium]